MGERSGFSISHLLILLIFLLGMYARMDELGAAPLSEGEARVALQALAIAEAEASAEPGVHPGYAVITGLLFFLFGDTNFLARFAPALAGAFLVLAPWVLRRRLGTPAALVMSAGLALDPLLVGVSRLADGPMLAAGLVGTTVALRIANNSGEAPMGSRIATGILAGLALLSGPAVWLGLMVLVITWGVVLLIGIRGDGTGPSSSQIPEATAFGLTVLLAGTLLLRAPQGLSAVAGSLTEFLSGWISASGVDPLWLLAALAGYNGLAIVFALANLWTDRRDLHPLRTGFLIASLVALSLLLVYQGRQVGDLVWVVVPLWAPAAAVIAAGLQSPARPAYRPALLALVLVGLAASFWVNLAGVAGAFPQDPNYNLRLLVLAGTLVLGGLSILLVALGWDAGSARTGSFWALGILLLFGLVRGLVERPQTAGMMARELYLPSPAAGDSELLIGTLNQLSDWSMGDPLSLDVALGSNSPSAAWVLRRFPNLTHTANFAREDFPSAIITDSQEANFQIASAYRGQGLDWRVNVLWGQMTGRDWLHWFLFREAPAVGEQIYVWARADLFPAGEEIVLDDPTGGEAQEVPPEEIIPLEDIEEIFPND